MAHAAVKEDEDAAFGGGGLRGGERPQAEEVAQGQASGAEGGALQELTAGGLVEQGSRQRPHEKNVPVNSTRVSMNYTL